METSTIGLRDFTHSQNFRAMVTTDYFQSIFTIMDYWKVLPTNKDFRALSVDQINLLMYGIEEKNRKEQLAAQAASGQRVTSGSFVDNDTSWLYEDEDTFDPAKGLDIDYLHKQLAEQQAETSNAPGKNGELLNEAMADESDTPESQAEQNRLAQKALEATLKTFNKGGE